MALLEVDNLAVTFETATGPFRAVDGVSLRVNQGEILAIVGESGSGKSVAMLAVMGLLPWTADVTAERMAFDGHDLMGLSRRARRRLIGRDMAMIFQEPMASLNPCFTIGFQIGEVLATHMDVPRQARRARVVELLGQVGIPSGEKRLGSFPHQLSGGMNQRVMIAMALACNPRLLIADEPTTALDVTIQAQILDLLSALQKDNAMALVLITHDMGVVAETADRVSVQYAGQQVEEQLVGPLFETPRHPYTSALLAALPERLGDNHNGDERARLPVIPGVVPGAGDRPRGCLFHPRCAIVKDRCRSEAPVHQVEWGNARCHFPLEHPA